jgi:ATP-dependent helicase/nuclease subunit B
MSVNRIFLDWKQSFLNSSVDFFLQKSKSQTFIDLSDFYVLTTVSRVGRRLIERLVFAAEEKGLGLSPPQVLSISSTYNLLLPKYKLVNKTQSRLIFLDLLKSKGSELERLDTAKFLAETYMELTKNGQSAEASINKVLEAGLYADESRWLHLLDIFNEYKKELKIHSLIDTVDALEIISESDSKINKPLILLACFDLSTIISRTIEAGFSDINSLIFAPESIGVGFNELGKVELDFWQKRELNLDSSKFKTLSSYDQEIENIFEGLDLLPSSTRASQVSIGACDEKSAKILALKSLEHKLPLHLVATNTLISSCQAQALISALTYLNSQSFSDLAALISIPNLPDAIKSFLVPLNKYRIEALQPRTQTALPGKSQEIQTFLKELNSILAPIDLKSATAAEWLTAFRTFLTSLFAENDEVLNALGSLLSDLFSSEISRDSIRVLILEALSLEVIPSASDRDEVDVIGWLELCLDDAPNCFVYALNDGNIPAPISANSLLPDTLRSFLGLDCFSERLARDKYILESLLNSKTNLNLSCSRFSEQGEALLPSRILLETDQAQKLQNLESFFMAKESESIKSNSAIKSAFSQYLYKHLTPKVLPEPLQSVSVSALNDYLKCPYYFYLKHVLKLRQEDPEVTELSAAQVGTLLHNTLANFGVSAIKDSQNPEDIEDYLITTFEKHFFRDFGKKPFSEVLVQSYQIRDRLKKFSLWQSQRPQSGWSIYAVELDFQKPGYAISQTLSCTGRIDRIDYNSESQTYSIIDYKSGDNFKPVPYNTKVGWQDLQLALYWLYCEEILNLRVSELSYLSLKLKESDLALTIFEPEVAHLDYATEAIKKTGAAISHQIYWPPKLKTSQSFNLAPIYQLFEVRDVS